MAHLINKDTLVAEIEKIIDILIKNSGCIGAFGEIQITIYEDILSLINTLEVKEVKNIWHIVSETDLPKVGEHICCIKNGNILSGEYRANKFYGKVCNGYDNPIDKGDRWCLLTDIVESVELH